MSSANSVERKIALQMLILKKTKQNDDRDINKLVRALPEPLKSGVKKELDNMVDMSLDELNAELKKYN